MSVCISLQEFKRIAEKECLKQTSLPLEDFPDVIVEDFWPALDPDDTISVKESKVALAELLNSLTLLG
jgi:hypothetical protein